MKRILLILFWAVPAVIFAQQFPSMEGYNLNPFILSPAYAGIHNGQTLFIDYRSDLTGFVGGPTTCQLSYSSKLPDRKTRKRSAIDQSDSFRKRVGLGGRFIYDKTDIFAQILLLGTYTYEIKIAEAEKINFALSAGFYRNSIDLAKYYSDPKYAEDMVILNILEKSKIKFATDASILYRYKQAEAGLLFSNVMFGVVRFQNTNLTYKPLKNYIVHAAYQFNIDNSWSAKPVLIVRGGQNIPAQVEVSSLLSWKDRFWGTLFMRTSGMLGLGVGGEIHEGIILNYSYNLITNPALVSYGSHQVTLGIKLFTLNKNKVILK